MNSSKVWRSTREVSTTRNNVMQVQRSSREVDVNASEVWCSTPGGRHGSKALGFESPMTLDPKRLARRELFWDWLEFGSSTLDPGGRHERLQSQTSDPGGRQEYP